MDGKNWRVGLLAILCALLVLCRSSAQDGKATVFGKVVDGLDVATNFVARDPLKDQEPAAPTRIQSITIDEADTYLVWVARSNPSHWEASSNNHVLNSLLMRLSTSPPRNER